jgi:hypothetical protein
MAGKVLNIKVCSPLKLRSVLIEKKPAICHYSYNLPLPARLPTQIKHILLFATAKCQRKKIRKSLIGKPNDRKKRYNNETKNNY